MMRSGQLGRHKGGALPLPLAGEGWGGGVSATDIPRPEIAPTRRFAPTSPASAGQSHLQRTLVGGFLAAILRDARLWRAPQDEVLFRGEILDPHGEKRRSRRVSNHEATYAAGPYAIAPPASGRGEPSLRQNRSSQTPSCSRQWLARSCAGTPDADKPQGSPMPPASCRRSGQPGRP